MADFRFYLNRQGPKGEQGVKGDKGFSPQVNIGKNTANEFTLLVTNEYDTFETPNLRGDQIENRGGTYVRYDQDNNKLYAADADHATESQYGIVQIANDSDIKLGAEDKVITAGQLQAAIENITTQITEVNDGTLTINYGTDTVGTFSANQATSTTITIPKTEVDLPNNGKLTINYGTTEIGVFTANQSTDSVVNIPESEGVTVDDALSVTSTNPVENKVITSTINTLTTDIDNIVSSTSTLNATVTQHTEDISGLSTDLDNVSATVSNLGRDVTNLTNLCGENSTAIGSLQNTITTKADTSSLSAVALTGEYSDLLNPPEIPVVNNSTITLSDGESTLASFTLNQDSDATITIPKGEAIVTDNALNAESTNPIQNKPVAEAVNSLTTSIEEVNTALANKADKSEIPSTDSLVTLNSKQVITTTGVKNIVGDVFRFNATNQNSSYYNTNYMSIQSNENGMGQAGLVANGTLRGHLNFIYANSNPFNNPNVVSLDGSSLWFGSKNVANRQFTIRQDENGDLAITSANHQYKYQNMLISSTDVTFTPAGSTTPISLLPTPVDDTTVSTESVWSSAKTNEQIQVGNIATLETCTESFIHNDNVIQGEGVVITTTTVTETTETSTVNSTQLTIGINYNTTPATTIATASKTSPSVVIDEFVSEDGTSGYRTWSNGYCEQWGKVNNTPLNTWVKISLLKKFANKNYSIYGTCSDTSAQAYVDTLFGYKDMDIDSFWCGVRYFSNITTAADRSYNWQANGYLAQGEY